MPVVCFLQMSVGCITTDGIHDLLCVNFNCDNCIQIMQPSLNIFTCIFPVIAKSPIPIVYPGLVEPSIDIEEIIARLQELDPTLTTLNLNNHPRLEEDIFQQLCDALVANTYLTTLELAGTKLHDNHAKVR